MPWAVLLVDDNASIRGLIRGLFDSDPDFQVVAEAEHGVEAIDRAIVFQPHLIVLDFSMPVMNGLEAAPKLLEHLPTTFIIMLTLFTGDDIETTARAAGIHAFVPKNNAGTHLLPAAHALFDPRRPFTMGTSA
jgi:DNA-binding NarL/FixJ family response regulator